MKLRDKPTKRCKTTVHNRIAHPRSGQAAGHPGKWLKPDPQRLRQH
jgi:hypothetical protein